jgi:hypothetical protein
MKRFLRTKLTAAFILGVLAAAALEANAQIQFGPQGQIGIPNWFGTTTWIHPDRLNPLANIPITPPQSPPGVLGKTWMGADGKMHGNVFDPNTGNYHLFNHKGGGQGVNNFLTDEAPAKRLPQAGQRGNHPPQVHRPAIGPSWRIAPAQPSRQPVFRPRGAFRAPQRRW